MIEVRADSRTGELHVRDNQITHAKTAEAEGKRALVEMLTWIDPHFIENVASPSAPRTIYDPWPATLTEALREAKKSPGPLSPPAQLKVSTKPSVTPAKQGPKILVIDDTEMLLIFVADSLGRIWFSLNRGLVVADPARLTSNAAAALVHLERILADGRAIDLTELVRIPATR